jgi:hypothetical protein
MTSSARTRSATLSLAMGLVRTWTRAYTWRLELAVRDRRRGEIESELWEFQQDPERGTHPAAHVLVRLLTGIPDDLSWRAEHVSASTRRTRLRAGIRVAAWTVATVIIAAAIWILPLMTAGTLPPLPDKPRVKMAAPPPPPPPPCAPPGYPQFKPCAP